MACKIINLKENMPTVEEARTKLLYALKAAKMTGNNTLKIIHGYGSTGKGGAIKQEVSRILTQKKREGTIREFVKGEDFSPFSENARNLLAISPALKKDVDYSKGNDGITIVII